MDKRKVIQHKKARLIKQRGGKCQRCGSDKDYHGLELDHVTPLQYGGNNNDDNIALLCHRCHEGKTVDMRIIDVWERRGISVF